MNRIFNILNRNLIVPLLIAGSVPLLFFSAVSFVRSGDALEENSKAAKIALNERVEASLQSIRDERKRAIEDYFGTISNQIVTFSADPSVIDAMRNFEREFDG